MGDHDAAANQNKEWVSALGKAVLEWQEQYKRSLEIPLVQMNKLIELPNLASIAGQAVMEALRYPQIQQQILDATRVYADLHSALSPMWKSVYPDVAHLSAAIPDMAHLSAAIQAATTIARLTPSLDTLPIDALRQQIQDITRGMDWIDRWMTISLSVADAVQRMLQQLDVFGPLREVVKDEENAVGAFRSAGWPIAPSMPRELIRRVTKLHQNGKTRYATQVIAGYYRRGNCKPLAEAVDKWRKRPCFESRMHIIDDALTAHREGKYTLSVPALLAQVEGVMNEYVAMNHLSAKLGKMPEVYRVVIGDPMSNELATWGIAETLLCQLSTNTYVWTDFSREIVLPLRKRRTTRHTVLHGIMIGYDRESISLKTFLLLDALSALPQFRPSDEEAS